MSTSDGAPQVSKEVARLVEELDLAPHPEGGWFRRCWESPQRGPDGRRLGSAILFLLGEGAHTRWHRVDATELWTHAAGGAIHLEVGDPHGATSSARLGHDVLAGDEAQVPVPAGEWQRARSQGWALAVCTVVPEFVDEGFEMLNEPRPGRRVTPTSSH